MVSLFTGKRTFDISFMVTTFLGGGIFVQRPDRLYSQREGEGKNLY